MVAGVQPAREALGVVDTPKEVDRELTLEARLGWIENGTKYRVVLRLAPDP